MAVLSEVVENYKSNRGKFAFFIGAGLSMPFTGDTLKDYIRKHKINMK
jgi:hypothetical protein